MKTIKQKRELSQVFLRNKNIQKRIANAINSSGYKFLLEIGPGCGQITQYIELEEKVYLGVEVDSSLCSHLTSKFTTANILNKDFLLLQEEDIQLFNEQKVLLFGNIPYSISTKILLKFLYINHFEESFLMIQKEFFESISAKCNTKQYSSLAVFLQSFCDISKLFEINRLNFYPKPKVDSIFFSIKKKEKYSEIFLKEYFDFIKKCFFSPRKILWNNLRKIYEENILEELFYKNNLLKNIRIQELEPEKIMKLFKDLKEITP
ncbi:16S rRNA (adenine(1518)-N(6)/adenine(1519)-N(6))-dimethyltransferase RsmA [Mycoplasma suis]|uniref:16S rRNA (adenine(1518)-N(6)/adenine(1519)-N(6))- dimethyltransferase RsmA n=1 Tax=Mycoplasma suis TaxID=57372 RepID=UPI0009D72A90